MTAFLVRLREGDADHPPLSAAVGGADGGRGARASTSSPCATGWPPTDPAAAVKPPSPAKRLPKALPARRRGGDPRGGRGARHGRWRCATGPCWRCSTAPGPGSPRRSGSTSTTSTSVDGTVLLRGKGGKERLVPVGSLRPGRASTPTWSRARPELVGRRPRHAGAVPQRPRRPAVPAERLGGAGQGRRAGRGDRATSRRTRCATPSPPTCSTAAPTCASCRSCSATPRSRPPRSTRWSPSTTCARSSPPRTPGPAMAELAHPTGPVTEDDLYDAFTDWAAAQGLCALPAPGRGPHRAGRRRNVILATPTGSGKSLVALGGALRGAGRRTGCSFYTAPIKALVSEKFFALCEVFGADNVGMLTGDAVGQRRRADHLLHRRGAGQHRAARGRATPTSAWS